MAYRRRGPSRRGRAPQAIRRRAGAMPGGVVGWPRVLIACFSPGQRVLTIALNLRSGRFPLAFRCVFVSPQSRSEKCPGRSFRCWRRERKVRFSGPGWPRARGRVRARKAWKIAATLGSYPRGRIRFPRAAVVAVGPSLHVKSRSGSGCVGRCPVDRGCAGCGLARSPELHGSRGLRASYAWSGGAC